MSQIPLINSAAQVLQSFAPGDRVQSATASDQKSNSPSFAQVQAESAAQPKSKPPETQLRSQSYSDQIRANRQEQRPDATQVDDDRVVTSEREIVNSDQGDDASINDIADTPDTKSNTVELDRKPQQSENAESKEAPAQDATLGTAESAEESGNRLLRIGQQLQAVVISSDATAVTSGVQSKSLPGNKRAEQVLPELAALRGSVSNDATTSSEGQRAQAVESDIQHEMPVGGDLLEGMIDPDDMADADAARQVRVAVEPDRAAAQPLTPRADASITKQDIAPDRLQASNVPQAVPSSPTDGHQSGSNLGERSGAQRQDDLGRVTASVDSTPKQSSTDALFQIDRLADAGNAKADYSSLLKTGSEASQTARQLSSEAHGVDGRLVTQSVSRGLAAAIQQNEGEVVLRLSPASLGVVRIKMSLDHGVVSVRLEATTQAAQQAMSDNLSSLRNSLESRGLAVERISVHHAPLPSGQGSSSSSQQGSTNQSGTGEHANKHDAGDAPSHGRHDGGAENGMFDADGMLDAEASDEQASFDQQFHVRLEAVA